MMPAGVRVDLDTLFAQLLDRCTFDDLLRMTDHQIADLVTADRDEEGRVKPRRAPSRQPTEAEVEMMLLQIGETFGQGEQARRIIAEKRKRQADHGTP